MSSPEDAVKRVVDAFERSDWSEIDVRWGNVRVHLSTSALEGGVAASSGQPVGSSEPSDRRQPDAEPDRTGAHAPDAGPPAGAHVVVAPSPGIFWRSPEPGLPPFADVGDVVEASATVCIVEVMKLMNHVKAGVAGAVVAVYGENGVAVQKGQPLFAIVPTGASA
ncbi:MAG TPA: biotin/lipoyl-containing protein [Ilumatobacteraceae bacterium]|nr:biotin/lipoyl-containing protein [Ilumatobacteraceae bacterium]